MEIRTLTDADVDGRAGAQRGVRRGTQPDGRRRARAVPQPDAAPAGLPRSTARSPAFAIAYAPGTAYDSINYAWHADRFDDFLYLDRIAIGSGFRRRGIASALYDAMEDSRGRAHGRMVCEIYSDPPNEESIAFHTSRGYREVGHLAQPNGHETVMMEKPLERCRAPTSSPGRCADVMWSDDAASQALGMTHRRPSPPAPRPCR